MLTVPYVFQRKAARKLHEWNGRGMLAMDPGLGKTLSALMYAHRHPQALPVVVLCPASIKWAWQRQCRDHFGWNATVLEGMQPPKGPLQTNDPVVILNYDILASWVDKLKDFHPKMIVFDECQALCHSRAKRTKSAKLLAKGVQHIVPLSGTPLMNRPAEMYNVLHMLRPKMFPSAWSFYQRYCDLKRRPWGWEYKGATNTEELHAIITDPKTGCMIRYRKQDVLHELPAKRRIIVPLPISNRKEYEFAKNDFINWLAQRNISRLSAAERATCFPYNTLVDTELGRLPIGEIVENELKLKVRCVDTKTSEIQWRPITAYTKRTSPRRMVRIEHEHGELTCTPDHLIWASRGYIRAEKITPGLLLSMVQQETPKACPKQGKFRKILRSKLRRITQRIQRRNGKTKKPSLSFPTKRQNNNQTMQNMRENNSSKTWNMLESCSILFPIMLQQKRIQTWIKESCGTPQTNNRKIQSGKDQKWRKKKRYSAYRTNQKETIHNSKETMGREKPPQNLTKLGNADITAREEIAYRTKLAAQMVGIHDYSDSTTSWETTERGSTFSSTRSSTPANEISNRNRRKGTSTNQTTKSRSQKRNDTRQSRVVRVEIYEHTTRRGSEWGNQKNQVYDIEVETTHNFFANGILVHNCMVKQGYLIRLVGEGKVKAVKEWTESFLEESSGKLCMFGVHKKVLGGLQDHFGKLSLKVDGSITGRKRDDAFETFKKGSPRLLLAQLIAAGTGWSAEGIGDIAFAEFGWRPADHTQAEDRAHGIGRGVEGVQTNCYWLCAADTIEETLVKMLDKKSHVLGMVLDGKADGGDSLDIHAQLTQELLKENVK